MEYCSTVWDAQTKQQVNTIEKIQRRAARWVTGRFHNTSSVTSMINELQWRSLQQRRTDSRLILWFKIKNELVNIPYTNHFTLQRNGSYIIPIHSRTKYTSSLSFPAQLPIGTVSPSTSYQPTPYPTSGLGSMAWPMTSHTNPLSLISAFILALLLTLSSVTLLHTLMSICTFYLFSLASFFPAHSQKHLARRRVWNLKPFKGGFVFYWFLL